MENPCKPNVTAPTAPTTHNTTPTNNHQKTTTQTHINDPYNTGTQVQCLKPKSPAFQHYNIDPNQHTHPITAYDNNNTPTTGFTNQGITLYATCENATYQHSPTPPPHMRKIIDIKQDDKWTQFWFADGKNNPTHPTKTPAQTTKTPSNQQTEKHTHNQKRQHPKPPNNHNKNKHPTMNKPHSCTPQTTQQLYENLKHYRQFAANEAGLTETEYSKLPIAIDTDKALQAYENETPKQHQPFNNQKEYTPHRGKWIIYKNKPHELTKPTIINNEGITIGNNMYFTWNEAYQLLTFEDGKPFGKEITQ